MPRAPAQHKSHRSSPRNRHPEALDRIGEREQLRSFTWSTKNGRIDALWEGNDEMDPAYGDIHCTIQEGELCGTIGLFNGDRSAFRAVRENK